jgi:hypothetical protein
MSDEAPLHESLTARQREWLSHLEAWRAQGGTLKAYALAHGLSLGALYRARRVLERRGMWNARMRRDVDPPSPPKLVPVCLSAAPTASATFRVVLPNGVAFEIPEHTDPVRCRAVLSAVCQALR